MIRDARAAMGPTKLTIFDFDGTLFLATDQEPKWWDNPAPFSWGSDPASLSPPCVPERPGGDFWNGHAVRAAQQAQADPRTILVIITARVKSVGPRVTELLTQQGVRPDRIYFNPGANASTYKKEVMRRLLLEFPALGSIVVWENENTGDYDSFLRSMKNEVGRDFRVQVMPVHKHLVQLRCARTFSLNEGDPILYGKYKNKEGLIKGFGVGPKGNPTVIIEPQPKGRKQDKEMGLFRIWQRPAVVDRVATRWLASQSITGSFRAKKNDLVWALRQEMAETKILGTTIRRLINGDDVSPADRQAAKQQVADIFKMLAIGASSVVPVPGASLAFPAIMAGVNKIFHTHYRWKPSAFADHPADMLADAVLDEASKHGMKQAVQSTCRWEYPREERCPVDPDIMDEIHECKLGVLNGRVVWLVNGQVVRDRVDVNFTDGGNPARYGYVPHGEFWLDHVETLKDLACTLFHEATETYMMEHFGYSYEGAHDRAADVEGKMRESVPPLNHEGEVVLVAKDWFARWLAAVSPVDKATSAL